MHREDTNPQTGNHRQGLDLKLQIDGGVNLDNLTMNLDAGADVIVAGSAVFKGNITENTEAFLEKMQEKY